MAGIERLSSVALMYVLLLVIKISGCSENDFQKYRRKKRKKEKRRREGRAR